MTITVNGPNGVTIRFPEGTDPDTINRVMAQAVGGKAQMAPPKQEHGTLPSALEGLAQGVSLGFADEIEGGARALYGKVTGDKRSFGELYDEGVAIPRARVAAAKDSNPVAFYAGDIGGSLVLPGGLARAGIRGPLAAASGRGLGARSVAGGAEAAADRKSNV